MMKSRPGGGRWRGGDLWLERCVELTAEAGEPNDLLTRTKKFALRIVRLYVALPKTTEAQVLGKQVLRSGTSVGAQLHEGKRSRSDTEMISKTESALQKLEETAYWLELLSESGIVEAEKLSDLRDETDQLTAMLVTSVKTLKIRNPKR